MSGIYIPDMALPERGVVYSLFLYPDGRVHLWRGPEAKVGHEFMAIPVPDHGDLIDRTQMREATIYMLDKVKTDLEANAIR